MLISSRKAKQLVYDAFARYDGYQKVDGILHGRIVRHDIERNDFYLATYEEIERYNTQKLLDLSRRLSQATRRVDTDGAFGQGKGPDSSAL